MTDKWDGFTPEEILKVTNQKNYALKSGWNNNPNSRQLKTALKALLLKSNVSIVPNANICDFQISRTPMIEFRNHKRTLDDQEENKEVLVNKETSHLFSSLESIELSSNTSPTVKKGTFKQNKYGKNNMARDRMLKTSTNKYQQPGENNCLPQEARLFIPQIPEEDEVEESTLSHNEAVSSQPSKRDCTTQPDDSETLNSQHKEKCESLLFPPANVENSLDEFEKRQKIIKEQNRQNKELLKKALEDRTKKTKEEAQRLGQIEDELKKLDIKLSNDIYILRNQIEVASLDFMEAQKRYDRAEKEYLDAKMTLFTKREHKDLLTAHLCTIIEQNELRKAKKLSELMNKLNLGTVIIEKPMVLENVAQDTPDEVKVKEKEENQN